MKLMTRWHGCLLVLPVEDEVVLRWLISAQYLMLLAPWSAQWSCASRCARARWRQAPFAMNRENNVNVEGWKDDPRMPAHALMTILCPIRFTGKGTGISGNVSYFQGVSPDDDIR